MGYALTDMTLEVLKMMWKAVEEDVFPFFLQAHRPWHSSRALLKGVKTSEEATVGNTKAGPARQVMLAAWSCVGGSLNPSQSVPLFIVQELCETSELEVHNELAGSRVVCCYLELVALRFIITGSGCSCCPRCREPTTKLWPAHVEVLLLEKAEQNF